MGLNDDLAAFVDGASELVLDTTAVWANSAGANTAVDKDVAAPARRQRDALYLVIVKNPSAHTALTVVVKGKETFDAAAFPELTRFSVSASSSKGVLVQGWLLGEAGRLTLSNDTALGGGQGFTAYVRVRKV